MANSQTAKDTQIQSVLERPHTLAARLCSAAYFLAFFAPAFFAPDFFAPAFFAPFFEPAFFAVDMM